MRASIQDETNDVGKVLWVKGVAWRFAHVASDRQRDFLDLCVVMVAANQERIGVFFPLLNRFFSLLEYPYAFIMLLSYLP